MHAVDVAEAERPATCQHLGAGLLVAVALNAFLQVLGDVLAGRTGGAGLQQIAERVGNDELRRGRGHVGEQALECPHHPHRRVVQAGVGQRGDRLEHQRVVNLVEHLLAIHQNKRAGLGVAAGFGHLAGNAHMLGILDGLHRRLVLQTG